MQKQNNIIFAPHVDDELIGCWRVLCEGVSDVYYFFDLTLERKEEALNVAKFYNFRPHFVSYSDCLNLEIDKDAILHLPNISDNHVHHKTVNYFGKSFSNKKKYYSIDMNTSFDVLNKVDQEEKRKRLLMFYPSQETLLTSDEKYFLFESSVDTDVKTRYTYDYSKYTVKISGDVVSYNLIIFALEEYEKTGNFEKLVSHFPFRDIVLKDGDSEFIFEC